MLHPVTFRSLAVAACGWLLAWDAAALAMGRVRGAVLIGRPLEITIPVTLDPGEDSPCANGELFYGDTRVSRGLSMRWEPGSAATQGVLRVSSSTPVDEPIVTLYLRAGCGTANSRRYVMLSEVPPEAEPAAPAAVAPRAAVPAPRALPAVPPPVAAPAARSAPRPAATPLPRARREAAQAPARAQPRLKLEPLDLSIDRDPVLRLTSELRTQLAADPQQRTAAAALWQALQRDPEQTVQERLRLQTAERDLKSLREAAQQNAAAVAGMRTQVEQARGSRHGAALLVIGLSVLLAAMLAWLGWRWHRNARIAQVGRWFEANSELAQPPMPIVDAAAARRMAATTSPGTPGPVAAADPGIRPSPAAAAPAQRTPTVWPAAEEFQPSRGGTIRMVGVQELIDVHDKADFFLSIGEHEQAIGVLEAHVHDQVDTSALAWMDLLELYHRFGKRVEYERLRGEFRQRFTVQVPDFEHFDQPTASLENYSRALSRICALWPSRRVLEVIEESIFRKPGLPGAEPFSLDAYRDLVLLYHVAKEMAQAEEAPPRRAGPPTNFRDTSLQPLNNLDRPESTQGELDRRLVPPSSPRLGVDIELDEEITQPPEQLPALDFDVSGYEESDAAKAGRKRG